MRVIGQELEKDRYAVNKHVLRSVATLRSDRVRPLRRYDISPCILVYPSMLSPEDHSDPILRFRSF
ncbi:hypothetical protein F2Q70_00035846 [Brassica cretica]|uniref:Uncharacterized protein n=1 Tax=Brassica cretica TaxID=69181 RepID=A0A8S9JV27_BRACR|nr:hypothetical protein F2Q70_00035846 [Brassica cretica]